MSKTKEKVADLTKSEINTLRGAYRHMVASREIDRLEVELTGQGDAFFHVSGAGHEATALLADHLTKEDWLHVHYRDKALMLARGISIEMFFLSTFNKDTSHSRGRQMNAHMSDPSLRILSLVGPVGNSALQAVGVAGALVSRNGRGGNGNGQESPIVLCSLGEGMTQQGEVLEAFGQAVRDQLPVMFLVQDNAFAISTKTAGQTFYNTPKGKQNSFYSMPITYIDGRDPVGTYRALKETVGRMRSSGEPEVVVLEVDRLSNHTNADDHTVYRTPDEIEQIRKTGDPNRRLREALIGAGIAEDELESLENEVRQEVIQAARRAQRAAEPEPIHTAVKPLPDRFYDPDAEYTGNRENSDETPLTMLQTLRSVLGHHLDQDERVFLFGEDIEDPKGDVFGVTKGLTTRYPGRVRNSPLAESTIVGYSVGRALAGDRPVAFLQFADFLPIAYNQIWAELGSIWWRTDGGWQAPVILMISTGGYKPGLGPFHASSMESLAAHTPGVDVMMPATAGDAAGMLNAAFASERPTLFFYPKSLLNDRGNGTTSDVDRHFVPLARARFHTRGEHLTFVCWGNTVPLCRRAAETLEEHGVTSDVIDLRTIMPWDVESVVTSAQKTGRVIVAHEDSHSAGMGSEVIATIAERTVGGVAARRVTRGDTYVPCNFANQLEVLPSYRRILETAVELLEGEIHWKQDAQVESGVTLVEAIGSSPSDESVTVVEWLVAPGDDVSQGQVIAELEADKAAVELRSPAAGTVDEFLVNRGDMVKVGTPLIKLKVDRQEGEEEAPPKPPTREEPGEPIISNIDPDQLKRGRVSPAPAVAAPVSVGRAPGGAAGHPGADNTALGLILSVGGAQGSRLLSNADIIAMGTPWEEEDIVRRTGIETRRWLAEGETAVDLAVRASVKALDGAGIPLTEVSSIICATETPQQQTPATAALVQYHLRKHYQVDENQFHPPAYDINAACTGYVYGLQIAYDHLVSRPGSVILLVTAEALSPRLDMKDPGTAPIFGDAATATVVTDDMGLSTILGSAGAKRAVGYRYHRPVIKADGETGDLLSVPVDLGEPIRMEGPRVFQAAVKDMIVALKDAAAEAGTTADELDLIVPHQANQRIINAVRQRMKAQPEQVYTNIQHNGNTSSSTIPLCLEEILADPGEMPAAVGLTAFGGGFTYGAAILKSL